MIHQSPLIGQLHDCYCKLTDTELGKFPLTMPRIWAWDHWMGQGNTMDDLRLVVANIKRGIKDGRRFRGGLRFSHLIEDLANFQEERVLALGEARNQKPVASPKAKALQAFRPTTEQVHAPMTAVPVGNVIEKLIRDMRQAVDNPQV